MTIHIAYIIGALIVLAVAIRFANVMTLWQDFLDSLNTDGGHILLLALFVLICCLKWEAMGDLQKYQGELVGALLLMLKQAGSNKTRRDRSAPPPLDSPTNPDNPSAPTA